MNRAAHTRFLTYLETWDYFRAPGEKRMGREEWSELDTELEGLISLAGRRSLDEEEGRRRGALAQALMRD